MQNNNPYDDFMQNIARMVEEIMKNMPDRENTRFIGCTIIAGSPSDMPNLFQPGKVDTDEIEYEMIDSDETIFITAQIPVGTEPDPTAEITPEHALLCIGDQTLTIPFPELADVDDSFSAVRHGVLDIVVKKRAPAQTRPDPDPESSQPDTAGWNE